MEEYAKTLFSAIQPSGIITIGNYFGAIKNWVELQDDYNCMFALADLHAITVFQRPENLKKNTLEAYALLLACGIDAEKSLFFIQSQVNTHSQLAWILDCYTQFGELSRMTQFKDKSTKHSDNINCGLFAYPVLMVADILLYQVDMVPIGLDQKQHLELTRTVAERFNFLYGETFKITEAYIPKNGSKIMSLQDPNRKMSKSDENLNAWVAILDSKDEVIKKFKRAVTDSDSCVRYDDKAKPGISNLMTIYSCATGKSFDEIEKEFDGVGYGKFKEAIGECIADKFAPVQRRFNELIKDREYLEKCYRKGAKEAFEISNKTLNEVMKKIGFVQ